MFTQKQVLTTLGIIAILVLAYFAFKPGGWLRSSTPATPKNGDPCKTDAGVDGVWTNGICATTGGPGGPSGPTGNTGSGTQRSTNPNFRVKNGNGGIGYLVSCPGVFGETYCANLDCVDKLSARCSGVK